MTNISIEPRVALVEGQDVVNVVIADLNFVNEHVVRPGQVAYDTTSLPVSQGWKYDGDWLREVTIDGVSYIDRVSRDTNGQPIIGDNGFAETVRTPV